MKESVLNSIKTLKRNCQVTLCLTVFFNNNFFDDDKKSYLCERFSLLNQNYTTEHVKIVKNSRFFQVK